LYQTFLTLIIDQYKLLNSCLYFTCIFSVLSPIYVIYRIYNLYKWFKTHNRQCRVTRTGFFSVYRYLISTYL